MAPEAAFASPYVQGELSLALQAQKRIIPFWVEGEVWQIVAPLFMVKAQYIDARGSNFEAGVSTLLLALGVNHTTPHTSTAPTLLSLGPAPTPMGSTPAYHLTPMALYSMGFRGYSAQSAEYILPPLCPVPGGVFVMRSDKSHDKKAGDDETPQYPVQVNDFAIGQYPVTVAEYACFVRAGYQQPQYVGDWTWAAQLQHLDHPVVCVSWHDAVVFAK